MTDAENGNLEDWSVECSDDEKYEIKSKWATIGVSILT